jgi:dTDP-4-dehydrorhamnose 3,5-epimerase
MELPRLITAQKHVDDRGWLSETFHEKRLRDIGIRCRFVQENQSYSRRIGTLRGLHFQLPPNAQAKIVRVLRGHIFDVVVDLRRGSPTFGKYVSATLSSESGQQIYIPVGFAHGFVTLGHEVMVMYKVSNYFAPEYDCGIRWDDADISVTWPIRDPDIIVSDKDKRLPFLKEFISPFAYDGNPLSALPALDLK